MSVWFPLHCHSHFSLLDGLSKPEQIAERVQECGYGGSAITDHGSVSGCPGFLKVMQKKGLKAILGCEFYVCKDDATIKTAENKDRSHLCVLAKSLKGWKNLMRASSASYRPEHFYVKPRLDLPRLASFSEGEFIAFSGHMGSDLADVCFERPKLAYSARTYDEARQLVHPKWKEVVPAAIRRYQELFGKENFFLEIQLVDRDNMPAAEVVARILRHFAKEMGVAKIATADSHYARKEDAPDQRVLLCSAMDTTLKEVERKLANAEEVGLGSFFRSNNYHIPSPEEMLALHKDHPDELENTLKIAERCEVYKVGGGQPLVPAFPCPDGRTADEQLRHLCEAGWTKKVEPMLQKLEADGARTPGAGLPLAPAKREEYRERLEREFKVISGAGLSNYFLVVQDYIRHATDDLKVKVGKGRGSGAGSIVSYLVGITRVDPIRFGLLFERFYNDGRRVPGQISLPDIDSDFPIASRPKVIGYCRQSYGEAQVCQMATFSRMQGRGALKDVLRAHERCTYEEMNLITQHVPDEAEIADQLQEMREETGEASIILWALKHNPEPLSPWCTLNEDGTFDGPLALDFEQAIRLEGTKRSMGKHASGLIICSEPLADVCPLGYDRTTGESIVLLDMRDAESMGLVKFDILGLRTLDCVRDAESVISTGRVAA